MIPCCVLDEIIDESRAKTFLPVRENVARTKDEGAVARSASIFCVVRQFPGEEGGREGGTRRRNELLHDCVRRDARKKKKGALVAGDKTNIGGITSRRLAGNACTIAAYLHLPRRPAREVMIAWCNYSA